MILSSLAIICGSSEQIYSLSFDEEFLSYQQIDDERKWLTETYLPLLEGRVLFVGVHTYNKEYYNYVKNPELFETIDILPHHLQYGSPYVHHIGDFLTFDPGYQYDHICLFGILGMHDAEGYDGGKYTIDSDERVTKALIQAYALLNKNGTLQLGPPSRTTIAPMRFLQHMDVSFWVHRFREFPLGENQFRPLFKGYGPCNILWWGRKISINEGELE